MENLLSESLKNEYVPFNKSTIKLYWSNSPIENKISSEKVQFYNLKKIALTRIYEGITINVNKNLCELQIKTRTKRY